jgi:hypothetical protein
VKLKRSERFVKDMKCQHQFSSHLPRKEQVWREVSGKTPLL